MNEVKPHNRKDVFFALDLCTNLEFGHVLGPEFRGRLIRTDLYTSIYGNKSVDINRGAVSIDY